MNPILEAIDEWRKGCGNTQEDHPGHPEMCPECTVRLIKYIEEVEQINRRYEEFKPICIKTHPCPLHLGNCNHVQ